MTPLLDNLHTPFARLLLQCIVIILATRGLGALFGRLRQPAVIGEITAGILLGPSLFGWLWPAASGFIFPKESLGILQLFSQIGVCLFMFVVGLELEVAHLQQKARAVLVISHTGILMPFLFGALAAVFIFPTMAAPGTSLAAFALFMGVAMSITAFPVLARILKDRGMSRTPVGSMATSCAAMAAALAWAILAVVVAVARATGLTPTLLSLGLLVLFVAVMWWIVRPCLPRWLGAERAGRGQGRGVLATALVFMAVSALATEAMGIHALFGSFLAGVVLPQKREFREDLILQLENFSATFLLPLFFAFSGLRTHLGLLNDVPSWLMCAGLIALATIGKLGGTTAAARLTGMDWNDAFTLGALMNTRGLVELVALNIGYDLGILPPHIFTMMVLMALGTTFMTGPLLNLAARSKGAFAQKESVRRAQ